jgi:hypothetical protein
MKVPNARHEEGVSLLDQTMVRAELDIGSDSLEHAHRRADIATAIVEHHHLRGHLVLLQLCPVPSLVTDDLLEPGKVLLAWLDHGGARHRNRILTSAKQLGTGQRQRCQQVAETARGIAGTIEQYVPDATTSTLAVNASGGNQVGGPAGLQLPGLHHALTR